MKHRIRTKKQFQWQAVITIALSSTIIVLTLAGHKSIETPAFVTHAFILPTPTTTRSPSHTTHAISSRLTIDVPPLTSSVPPSGWNELRYPVTSSAVDKNKPSFSSVVNISALQTTQRLEIINGQLSQRRSSHDARYGGRALSFSAGGGDGRTDGSLWIEKSGRVGGNNGILGFDVGLHMTPSSSSSIPKIDTSTRTETTLDNPNSPIKKKQHEMAFITNGSSFEERNRMRMSSRSGLSRNDGESKRGGEGSTALMNRDGREGVVRRRNTSDMARRSVVPAWFPYMPTRSQILSLKVNQLKDACMERGITKTGRKAELQERLITWTREMRDSRHLRVKPNENEFDNVDVENDFSDQHGIDPLIARRKALLKANDNKVKDKGLFGGLDADEAYIFGELSNSKEYLSYLDDILGDNSRRHRIQQSKSISSVSKQLEQQKNADERERRNGVISSSPPSQADLSHLTKTFHDSPNNAASSNNFRIQQLYQEAKHADQRGDLPAARDYLTQLRKITGDKDTRVLRRLARLENQCGNYHKARAVLQRGLRARSKDDAYLLQGLGNLDLSRGDVDGARAYYKKAVAVAPKGYANPFHALGTLEYSVGNIHDASRVLRRGLSLCPTNHRLHHALGELYREAKMTQLAENEYRKGLECIAVEVKDGRGKANTWSKGFFYTALGYLEYERENIDECRSLLWKSVNYDGGSPMYEKGWLALAQLEESEGRVDTARKVYKQAIENYERKRNIMWSERSKLKRQINYNNIIPSNMGDRWLQVYNSWIAMEQNQGDGYDELNNLHSRIAVAFPDDWKNLQRWAKLQVTHTRYDRARTLFQLACDQAGSSNAEPYRLFAEFEMSLHNHRSARSILFQGAQSLSQSPDGGMGNSIEFAKLYHTWAVCEWHLKNLDRAETLFDHALRLTDSGEGGSEIRTLFLYSIARLLLHAREDYTLAQHCICISLSETAVPGLSVKSEMWNLWADIAMKLDNTKLVSHCKNQAEKVRMEKEGMNKPEILDISSSSGSTIHQLLRKAPWHHRIVQHEIGSHDPIFWYNALHFPDNVHTTKCFKKFDPSPDAVHTTKHVEKIVIS